jgi:hypothetical protein
MLVGVGCRSEAVSMALRAVQTLKLVSVKNPVIIIIYVIFNREKLFFQDEIAV